MGKQYTTAEKTPSFRSEKGCDMSEIPHEDEKLRQRAHEIIDRLPSYELRAAVIALEELEVSVQVRQEWPERHDEA
jgi:hypothetical protein